MRPRTVFFIVVLILLGAVGMRFLVVRFGLLPVSEQAVLRRAEAITVMYQVNGVPKMLYIGDRTEVNELLASLEIHNEDFQYYYGGSSRNFGTNTTQVKFHFPGGTEHSFPVYDRMKLGQFGVAPGFYDKLKAVVSRHEKATVDLLTVPVAPDVRPGQGGKAKAGNQGF